jgi:hypothetical protein
MTTITKQSILKSRKNRPAWWFTGVYGLQRDDEKISFLEELRGVRSLWPLSCLPH